MYHFSLSDDFWGYDSIEELERTEQEIESQETDERFSLENRQAYWGNEQLMFGLDGSDKLSE